MKSDSSMVSILHLNLHREFFAQIAAGTKRIEYRRRTIFWRCRLEGAITTGSSPAMNRPANAPQLYRIVQLVAS
jgi:hypothetical protein